MTPFTLNLKGRLLEISRPQVMGILNVTPDSFYAGSHSFGEREADARAAELIGEGADMIDVGGYSSRPGADPVDAVEEMRRVRMGIEAVRRISSDIPVSVDTFRADVARRRPCRPLRNTPMSQPTWRRRCRVRSRHSGAWEWPT